MATRANRIPAPSVEAADEAPPRRRQVEGVPMVRPTTAGFYLAYLANGDTPPWPLADRFLYGFTLAAGALSVVLGAAGVMA